MPESDVRWDRMVDALGLRWGGLLGALGAGLGVFAYLVGALLTPVSTKQNSGDVVISVILIRGLFVLVALGVVLGLSYYGGWRVARERVGSVDRGPSALAGAVVVLIYWFFTRLVGALVAFPPSSRLSAQDIGGQLLIGVLF